jgi:hypothetical protein
VGHGAALIVGHGVGSKACRLLFSLQLALFAAEIAEGRQAAEERTTCDRAD